MSNTCNYILAGCCWGGFVVCPAHGGLTITCAPTSGTTTVTGAEMVTIECFIESDPGDPDQVFKGALLDFYCDLPVKPQPCPSGDVDCGAGGTKTSCVEEDPLNPGQPGTVPCPGGGPTCVCDQGSIGGGDGFLDRLRADYLFSKAFMCPGQSCCVDPFGCLPDWPPPILDCVVLAAPPPSAIPYFATLPAGTPAYIGEIRYEVSACATGDFAFDLENFSDPPNEDDRTRFWDEDFDPIPFSFTPTTLTVVTGACCDGSTCLDDRVNAFCCEQNHPGAFFHRSQSCADSFPCRCRADVFPPGGSGVTDIDDILCGLQGFADMASCPDADLIPCGGNGIIDIADIVALLQAFAGTCPPCP